MQSNCKKQRNIRMILLGLMLVFSISCQDRTTSRQQSDYCDFESFNHPRIFIKYKQPVNGYDVTVVCLPYNYTYDKERNTEIWGNALLCFEKKDSRFYIYNESFSDSVLYYVNEQEVRDNMILELDYLPKSKNEYLSHNSPFFFSDVDFDGEEELIINNWRCGTRHCNTYDVYKIINNEAKRLIVEPFNKIESHAEFDSINKTIILNCYNGHRESYYKKYKQIDREKIGIYTQDKMRMN